MASVKVTCRLANVCFFIALIFDVALALERSVLAQLYQKASRENRPLVLVLDNSLKKDKPINEERPAPNSVQEKSHLPFFFLYHKHKLTPNSDNQATQHTHSPRNQINLNNLLETLQLKTHSVQADSNDRDDRSKPYRKRTRSPKIRNTGDRNLQNLLSNPKDRNYLRSSVIKNLLRYSNDLNCDAKDECEDRCRVQDKKKRTKCIMTCKVTYICEEPEEYEDPCERCTDTDCERDECGASEETHKSTRGVTVGNGKTNCYRC